MDIKDNIEIILNLEVEWVVGFFFAVMVSCITILRGFIALVFLIIFSCVLIKNEAACTLFLFHVLAVGSLFIFIADIVLPLLIFSEDNWWNTYLRKNFLLSFFLRLLSISLIYYSLFRYSTVISEAHHQIRLWQEEVLKFYVLQMDVTVAMKNNINFMMAVQNDFDKWMTHMQNNPEILKALEYHLNPVSAYNFDMSKIDLNIELAKKAIENDFLLPAAIKNNLDCMMFKDFIDSEIMNSREATDGIRCSIDKIKLVYFDVSTFLFFKETINLIKTIESIVYSYILIKSLKITFRSLFIN